MTDAAVSLAAGTGPARDRRTGRILWRMALLAFAGSACGLPVASGQQPPRAVSALYGVEPLGPERSRFTSRADSLDWMAARALAEKSSGFRLIVSLVDRRLWAIVGADTMMSTPVGVASGLSLEYQGRKWSFTTPRGARVVVAKDSFPYWVPPDWHYFEVARERALVVQRLAAAQPVTLDDGRRLEVRADIVGVLGADSTFTALPIGDEIIFDGFLFIPPLGTKQRRIPGALGAYRLDLGNGYLLHGTADAGSIGAAATHGCIRLADHAIAWLYSVVPIGTRVYIY